MPSETQGQPPSREEILAALTSGRSPLANGVNEVRPREDDFLLVLRAKEGEGTKAFAYLWPDAELTGESTGEPQSSLDDWVIEVGLDLDEFLATEPPHRLEGEYDAASGLRIVRRYGTGS